MSNQSTPDNPTADDAAPAVVDESQVETEVKYRPAGWVVESTVDERPVAVSEPHSARVLAEALARELTE